MKKIFVVALILISQKTIAQDTAEVKWQEPQRVHKDKTPQGVFAEIFGRAISFSLDYDRRILKRDNGWGFCIGAGLIDQNSPDSVKNYLAVPVSIYYLAGSKGNYLELGAGFTYFNTALREHGIISSSPYSIGGNSVIGTLIIGYRSQPVNGHLMFRIGISPIISKNDFRPDYPYISFGYNF